MRGLLFHKIHETIMDVSRIHDVMVYKRFFMIFDRELSAQMIIKYYNPQTREHISPLISGQSGVVIQRVVETHEEIKFRFATIAEAEEHAKIINQKIKLLNTVTTDCE